MNELLWLGAASGIGLSVVLALTRRRPGPGAMPLPPVDPVAPSWPVPTVAKVVQAATENAQSAAASVAKVAPMVDDWIPVLLAKTSAHEGTYWSVQQNLDGQGVSYGILQWTQRGGGLYEVLRAMQRVAPDTFATVFGGPSSAAALLEHARAKNLAPLEGAVLWADPWLSRFRAAGRMEVFQQAQREAASTSHYMTTAVEIGKLLGVLTERAMVVYFNRTVHQGSGGAMKQARALASWYAEHPGSRPNTDLGVLAQYGWQCAQPFRRTTPGENPPWKPVTEETDLDLTGKWFKASVKVWHRFAGPWDLYELIVKRTSEILTDPTLRDLPVRLPPSLQS